MYVIDNEKPIYLQIVEQTRVAILKGYLKDGDKFYSVREMAKNLLINQSTVAKAYKELETLGLIESVVGSGTFIKIDEGKKEIKRKEVKQNLKASLLEAVYYEISFDEIKNCYDEIIKGVGK